VPVEVTLDDLRMQAPDYVSLRALFTELDFSRRSHWWRRASRQKRHDGLDRDEGGARAVREGAE
jgi:hypothetical protein